MPKADDIKFSDATLAEYRATLLRYPTRQAALIPTLWMAQREFGWLSPEAEHYVAQLMELPIAHVHAVVTFYTMFHRKPVGRFLLDVCVNLSCRLRGADAILECLRHRLHLEPGETTPDNKFTLGTVECLASCGTAPMLQLNQDGFIENLTVEKTLALIDELAARGD
jgi:NADH-quinone oxidoreductase subunit E